MIVAVPLAPPVTTPVPAPTAATAGALLDHAPPPVALVNVVEVAGQIINEPTMAAGSGLTVSVRVRKQPVPSVYEIVDVPAAIPVATPVDDNIVATVVLLLDHVPGVEVLVSVAVAPTQTAVAPPIKAGSGLTVTTLVELQPKRV